MLRMAGRGALRGTASCGYVSSSALRANIARFLLRPRPRGLGATLGALPLKPRQGTEFPAPSAFCSELCGYVSSSALRANIARFLSRPRPRGLGATLGALPLKPRQGTSRCSIVAFRPAGRIARFAPRLRVAVSATGRAPLWRSAPSAFCSELCGRASSSALRANIAR